MSYKTDILLLRAEGKSYSEIVSILGCSKSTVSYYLGEKQKEKTKNRRVAGRKNFQNYLRTLKEESGCYDCGNSFPHFVLEFDHRSGTTKVGNVWSVFMLFGLQKAKEELEKCDIVCANCHNVRTWNRNNDSS